MHAMSLNAFASQAAINAKGRFTVARIYKFLLSEPGVRLCSKSRSSLLALGKFIGLLPFPPTRNSGKGSLTSEFSWGPTMPEQWYSRGAVTELRTMETYKKIVSNYACFCQTTMLIPKIIKENIENLLQFDLDNDKS